MLGVQLSRLDEQTAHRHANAAVLDRMLGRITGVVPQKLDARCTRNGHYAYIFHFDPKEFGGISSERFLQALEAEGISCEPGYPPVHSLDVFRSGAYRKRLGGEQASQEHGFLKQGFPNAQRAFSEAVWIPQTALLGDDEDMQEIAAAVGKIQKHAGELG